MERPLKMSSLESPTTSSTEPTSSPCASTTFQPGLDHEPRDRVACRHTVRPAEQPDGTLRGYGMRIREHVEDLDLAGDPFVVAALEAARRHLGRDAVAEVVGAAEAQALQARRSARD